ncbi:hypothetical protein R3P38DRAFT_2846632 [Favolaschia claudopus]|uniref:VWFA domain-containing protein n=1 Tax=Favolaschia claudopus TaxID=2862362 RepID=A0AAW0DRN4_9AGAR
MNRHASSKLSSNLPVQGQGSSDLTTEPVAEAPKRRSFLSAVFGHRRSRSADPGDAPPSYETVIRSRSLKRSKSWLNKPMRKETLEDALETLRQYDTVILVDDSGSMSESGSKRGVTRWFEAGQALQALAEVAQRYDEDGIDIHFLNNKHQALNMRSSSEVRQVFEQVQPHGTTPTAERLDQLLKPYLTKLEAAEIQPDGTPRDRQTGEQIKRINFIVITDGISADDPKYPIIEAATRLKAMRNLTRVQLGIQFVQIGNDEEATRGLQALDDNLTKERDIWDIVDTTPYSKLNPVTADGLIKVLLGGINRRVDEQQKGRK